MSKRKSSADLRHGFNVTTRRPSVANLSARAINLIHRKPGVTNVRSTSSQKVVRSYADKQRNNSNVAGAPKCSVARNETTNMPKTRFHLASGSNTHTSRLKQFPVESVRKTVASWSYSPSLTRESVERDLCKQAESPAVEGNENTWATNLPSHGYGDTLKLCPAIELGQRPQQGERNLESPKKAVTISQQHMTNEQNLGKINQSEAMLNERVPSHGQPIHRPFVPNVAHGMVVRTSSPHRSAVSPRSIAQQGYTLRAEHPQQQQREQVSSTAVEQTQRPQVSVCHQVSQISRQSEADQPNHAAPITLRNIIPWKIDDTPTVGDYEIQPIGGRNAMTQGRASCLDEKPQTQRQVVATGQSNTSGQEPCNLATQQQQQQQHHYPNRQGLSDMLELQNAQQMHRQLQNNMIRQQEMQQRALHQQQQMMAMAQQQIRQQPLAHQLKTTMQQGQITREPCSNFYDQPKLYSGQLPNTTTPAIHTNKMNMPHYRMLMQQENTGFKSLQTTPQHGWVHNQQVIGDHPNLKGQLKPFEVNLVSPNEKDMLSNNMKRYEQLKRTEVSPTADQLTTQQLAGVHWQQGKQCPQYQAAIRQYLPIQHIQQKPNPVPCQQYLSVQQDPQVSTVQAPAPMIHHFQQTRQTQQQKQQQQVQIIKQFDPSGPHRPSRTPKKHYPQFTIEMIRDQELLVANMRQQKIPENIMRRQFDALLSEQRRYLAFLSGQELAEKINEAPPRMSSRALRVDQRPDWMERITPARMNVQPPKNSIGGLNQQGTVRDDGQHPAVPERMMQYDQKQQQMFGPMLNDSQQSTTLPHPWRSPNRQDGYHSWQRPVANQHNVTAVPASLSFTSASMPQMLSPPQATFSWPQHNNDPQLDPQRRSIQFNDFQAQCQKQLPEQQPFQRQCQQYSRVRCELQPNQSQQMHKIQRENAINCQQMHQVEHMTSEQYQQREGTMMQAVEGEWSNSSNLTHEQHGACCKPDGPSSLLKLREFQKYIRPQRQNNGLQDAETVRTALEALKNPEAKKGLEYVAELGKKVTALKLNGTQDPSELGKIAPPPEDYLQRIQQQQQQPKISSNGLCNTRNANNPAPPPISFPKTMDRSPSVGYPRQYCAGEKLQANMGQAITHKMMAEKENGSVTSAMQQYGVSGTVFPGCGQAMRQYLPHQVRPINGQYQRSAISENAKSPIELQGVVPIMPYRFDASESLYQRQMEQLYRNRLNLQSSGKGKIAALTQGPGTSHEAAPASLVLQARLGNTMQPDCTHEQESSLTGEMSNHRDKLYYSTRVAENKDAIAPCLGIHQDTNGINRGQPEIREPKIIGGLTYLARKVDYLQNPPMIAPNTLMASKFLQQPSVNFN